MAGCDRSKETYTFTYDDTTKAVVAEHADWSPTQVRMEVARIFRPQYRQNTESIKRELSGEKQYNGTPFTFDETNGVHFKNGDGSIGLLEFHERQLRLTPDKYSEDEHRVSLLIDQTIRTGASEVVTSYPRGDGQRDIVVMTLDRTTGSGTMRVMNTQADHTADEIKSISKETFRHLSETSEGRAFVLSDAPLSQQKVQESFSVLHSTVASGPREAIRATKATISEVRHTAIKVQKFWEVRHEKKTDILSPVTLTDRLREMFGHPLVTVKIPSIHGNETNIDVYKVGTHTEKRKQFKPASRRDYRMHAGQFVSEQKQRMVKKTTEFKHRTVGQTHKEKLLLRKTDVHQVKAWPIELVEKLRSEKQMVFFRKKEGGKRNSIQTEIAASTHILRTKESIPNMRRETLHSEKVLWLLTVIKLLVRRHVRMQAGHKETVSTKSFLRDFSIAFVFWKLLRQPLFISQNTYLDVLIDRSKIVRRHDQENQSQENIKQRETLLLKEPTPWLLLAIIWHLVMIRESGMRTIQTKPKQKKVKKTTYNPHFAPQGVIFAFTS